MSRTNLQNFDKWTIIVDYKLENWTEWSTIVCANINANQFRLQEKVADLLWKDIDDINFVKVKQVYSHVF